MLTGIKAWGIMLEPRTVAACALRPWDRPIRVRRVAAFFCAVTGVFLLTAPLSAQTRQSIEFGVNHGFHAFDGVCNDPRFKLVLETSPGVQWRESASSGIQERRDMSVPTEYLFRDAADCHAAVKSGAVAPRDSRDYHKIVRVEQVAGKDPQFFGEDDSESGVAGDGVCNDPRFVADPRHPKAVNGTGLVKRDATDCRRAFLMRQAWVLESVNLRDGRSSKLAFGDDSGRWALDDECDDPRFVDLRTEVSGGGPMRDATDCRTPTSQATQRSWTTS